MAPLHHRLQKALERRQKAERAHLAETVKAAELGATAANLAAAAASVAKMPGGPITQATQKGAPP